MTTFNFLIKQNIKESWYTFKKNPWVLATATVIIFILSTIKIEDGFFPNLAVGVISIIIGYMLSSLSLSAADNNGEYLKFQNLKKHLPSLKDFFSVLFIGILSSIFIFAPIVVGLIPWVVLSVIIDTTASSFLNILSVILGILGGIFAFLGSFYIGMRINFATLTYLDKKIGVMASIKYSWSIVSHDRLLKVFLVMISTIGIFILGLLAIGVGVLIAYPIVLILVARLYRALDGSEKNDSVVEDESVYVRDDQNMDDESIDAESIEEEVVIEVEQIEDGNQIEKDNQ